MNKIVSDKYQESYIEETLPNGLKVILWHKEGYEKSYFVMATPMGAMDLKQVDAEGNVIEHPAGSAHFLEHKMFENENGEDVMSLFSNMGANVNAATSYDETCYYFTTTQDPIPALNLLLDFTQELSITPQSVEKEKGIILQEYQMGYQMSDFRLLREVLEALYQKHPLSYEILGTEESISNITCEDLQNCYRLNYHPSCMILVGVSGQPIEPILEAIRENQKQKHFEPISKVERALCDEPENVAKERVEIEMDIHTPKICRAYKLKGIKDAAVRLKKKWCIGMILDVYFSSMNEDYQRWLREAIISDYFGFEVNLGDDYGYMMFYGETEKLNEFEKLIEETLSRAVHEGIDEKSLEQLKRRYFGQNIKMLNDFEGIGITMFRDAFEHLDFFEGLDIVENIMMKDIQEVLDFMNTPHKTTVMIQPRK